ncbi:glycoside hydrolase family 36 N-terminal domain-containing protein, partial [Bacteroides fragilis]|uniref:glycoside hydrolase family 36 N-terminal domain-containing protein n=1 Tax=Bacteroides fragilis TaxID=817 RepID=UPI00293521E2
MLKRTFILIGLVLSFCSLPAQELIQVTTRNTALVFRVANQSLRQVYYGPRLADTDVLQKQGNNFPAYSTYGMGEQSEVALHAVHADGNTSTLLNFENVKQESPEPGITLTTISLKDPLYPFQVKLFYKAYEESDLIEQWTIYQHTEKKPVTLYQFASAQLSFKSSSYRLTHFAGDWAGECNMSEVELTEGIKVIDSKLGTRATFFAHPMCLLSLNGRMTEDNGEVIGMALAWPANFKLEFEKNNNQELRVLAGMNPYASHYKLKKGDVFQTPSFLYTYECHITYILAASSPTYPIRESVYHKGWANSITFKNGKEYYGIRLPLGTDFGGPLFFTHYSYLGLDP